MYYQLSTDIIKDLQCHVVFAFSMFVGGNQIQVLQNQSALLRIVHVL